jgi:hypothetical protein
MSDPICPKLRHGQLSLPCAVLEAREVQIAVTRNWDRMCVAEYFRGYLFRVLVFRFEYIGFMRARARDVLEKMEYQFSNGSLAK